MKAQETNGILAMREPQQNFEIADSIRALSSREMCSS